MCAGINKPPETCLTGYLCACACSEPGERERGDDGHSDRQFKGHASGERVGGILLAGSALKLCRKLSAGYAKK